MILKYIMTIGAIINIKEKGYVIFGTVDKSRVQNSCIKDGDIRGNYYTLDNSQKSRHEKESKN